jgi:hypothetical protein
MYEKDYIKAIKYSKNEDVFQDLEGHQLHANNPILYPDWLRDHDKYATADFIEQSREQDGHYLGGDYRATLEGQKSFNGGHLSPDTKKYYDDRLKALENNKPFVINGQNVYRKYLTLHVPPKSENKFHFYDVKVPDINKVDDVIESLKNEGVEHID